MVLDCMLIVPSHWNLLKGTVVSSFRGFLINGDLISKGGQNRLCWASWRSHWASNGGVSLVLHELGCCRTWCPTGSSATGDFGLSPHDLGQWCEYSHPRTSWRSVRMLSFSWDAEGEGHCWEEGAQIGKALWEVWREGKNLRRVILSSRSDCCCTQPKKNSGSFLN